MTFYILESRGLMLYFRVGLEITKLKISNNVFMFIAQYNYLHPICWYFGLKVPPDVYLLKH